MIAFIKLLANVCRLKAGPQDMPGGRAFLMFAAAAYSAVSLLNFNRLELTVTAAVPAAQVAVFIALATALILNLRGVGARLPQTLTALYGSSALVGIGFLLLQQLPMAPPGDGQAAGFFVTSMSLALFFWSFVIDAHIFRNALNTTMWGGLGVAVMLNFFNSIMINPWLSIP